jgi:hypothetical protein
MGNAMFFNILPLMARREIYSLQRSFVIKNETRAKNGHVC